MFLCQVILSSCGIEYTYWEDCNKLEQEQILKKIPDNEELIVAYFGQFPFTDDDRTEHFLKTLCFSKNGDERMLKFYVLNTIIESSDGALREMLSSYCYLYLKENTSYLLHYLRKNIKIRNEYVLLIGAELYYNDIGIAECKQNLGAIIPQKDIALLNSFLYDVEKTISYIKR